jgi:hypothetical protein
MVRKLHQRAQPARRIVSPNIAPRAMGLMVHLNRSYDARHIGRYSLPIWHKS